MSLLHTIRPKDIESVHFDAEDELLTVEYLLPVDEADTDHASFTMVYDVSGDEDADLPPGMLKALRSLFSIAASSAAQHLQHLKQKRVPCETCNSACCRNTVIRLLPEDVARLTVNDIAFRDKIEELDEPSPQGYVAKIDASDGACPFLSDEGCTIYQHRPTICREYSAWTCTAYEADEEKVEGKRKLLTVLI